MAACSRLAWKGSSVVAVAGGALGEHRHASRPPSAPAATWCTTRSASRLRSRSMNSVPPQATSQPSSGQCRTSALETKRAAAPPRGWPGCRATRCGWPPAASAPGCDAAAAPAAAMPSTRSMLAPTTSRRAPCAAPASSEGEAQRRRSPRRAARAARAAPARQQRAAPRTQAPASVARGFEGHAARPTSVARTRPGSSGSRRTGVCLPWLRSAAGRTVQCAAGSNTHRSATPPSTSRPALAASEPSASPSTRTGRCVTRGQRRRQRQAARRRPTSAPG